MTDYLQRLNAEQKAAVTHTGGPLRVVAGAGTGKTRVLTTRIAYLVDEELAQPQGILAVTFTNKAAEEMQQRVASLIAAETKPKTATFHALGAQLLRRHADRLPVSQNFTIRDSQQSQKVVKEATKAAEYDPQEWKSSKVASFISRQKSAGKTAEGFTRSLSESAGLQPVVAEIWPIYKRMMRSEDSVDFADLLLLTKQLLVDNPDIRKQYQQSWQHILVDEYQDTNLLQSDLIKLLAGDTPNVFVVGDGDQTIYSWRGATVQNIFSFEDEFSDAETVVLSQNYRSTAKILQAGNNIIAQNDRRHEKDLEPQNEGGDKLELITASSEKDEAQRMVNRFKECETSDDDLSDWAVLYRTNAQSRVIEEALMQANVPYQIAGTSFFDRQEVRDLLAYIRLSMNPDADTDRRRIINRPRRGIGEKTLTRVLNDNFSEISQRRQNKVRSFERLLDKIEAIIKQLPPSEAVGKIISVSGLQDFYEDDSPDRLENMQELTTMAARFDDAFSDDLSAMREFLQNVALTSDQDTVSADGGVKLMTVHAAKGLEFPRVWICGLEKGLFPQTKNNGKVDEEERRLFYVALTRAQQKVVLSYAQSRQLYGSREWNESSPFLEHIDDDLLEVRNKHTGSGGKDKVVFFD